MLASRKEEASAAFKDLKVMGRRFGSCLGWFSWLCLSRESHLQAAPGARLDVYEGEVSRPSTLSPQALHGISAIISCMGIEVRWHGLISCGRSRFSPHL